MPAALKRKEKDGTSYRRPHEIQAWIEKLEVVDAASRLPQFEGASRKHPGYVPTEVVLHFLRRAWIDGEKGQFDQIFRILLKRVEQSLRSTIWNSRIGSATDIRDEVIRVLLALQWMS